MLYVYKCIKDQRKQPLGLGTDYSKRKFKVGDYITYDGPPTKDLDKAYAFRKGEYDIYNSVYDDGRDYRDYFKLVRIKLVEVNDENR